jgi:hypothetical protein
LAAISPSSARTTRRVVLRERDRPGAADIGLIDLTARYMLDARFHTVVEGMLYADRYGPMLEALVRDHRGDSRCYYLDAPLEETFARHGTKPDPTYLAQVTRSPRSTANATCCPAAERPSFPPPAPWRRPSTALCRRPG